MPEHAGRMTGLDGEVNTSAESSTTDAGGPRGDADQFWDLTPCTRRCTSTCATGMSIPRPLAGPRHPNKCSSIIIYLFQGLNTSLCRGRMPQCHRPVVPGVADVLVDVLFAFERRCASRGECLRQACQRYRSAGEQPEPLRRGESREASTSRSGGQAAFR